MAKKNLIKRSDYDRVLITETLPYETPIIFSNDGLYDRIKNIDNSSDFVKKLVETIVLGKGTNVKNDVTKPYLYKIRKNILEFRRLALLHPASQWKIREFYHEYNKLILYYCSKSPASIRSPKAIASSFFSKGSWEDIYKYKTGTVATDTLDGYAKHTPSFFSYKGYDRLYKFFNSLDYFNLEKKFQVQMSLDVSKCFDSIYTHSLAWATKEKSFIKQNLRKSSFGDDFDIVIRHGNDNETNGIPIGPELSRIFSEIIFQKIDNLTINTLKEMKLEFDNDYVFRRYVDDVYIFGRDEELAKKVYSVYADILIQFNLHTNVSKSVIQYRPFVSKKSRLIYGVNHLANSFFDTFLENTVSNQLKPKNIYYPWKLAKSFIDSIKSLCATNEVNYDEISSFIISSINERVKRLINIKENILDEDIKSYFNAIRTILDVIFFLYSVAPSVSSSYKLSTTIILLVRFTRSKLQIHEEEICHKIYDLTNQLLLDESQRQKSNPIEGFIHLEYINVLLAVQELGEPYLISESIIEGIFPKSNNFSYFTVVSCLFYIRNSDGYDNIRLRLIVYLRQQFSNLNDILTNSEKAHLFLDIINCPYLPIKERKKWVKEISKTILHTTINNTESEVILNQMENEYWHTNWSDIDLLNSLEKKELKQAY